MAPSSWWRAALVAVLVVWATGWARACHESGYYYDRGELAASEGRIPDAVVEFRHAAQWYAPGLSAPRAAIDALVDVGDGARAAGDLTGALAAWRSARMAILSTRWLRVPHADVLPGLHERIAGAMAAQVGAEPGSDVETRFRAQLDSWPERAPSPILGALASLAFFGWLFALAGLAWRGLSPDGEWQRAAALRWGGAAALCCAVWLICIRFA